MNKLLNYIDTLITNQISEALIQPDQRKITNELLDGSYHEQTIGDPFIICSIDCALSESSKRLLDTAYVRSERIKINWNGTQYNGLIQGRPSYSYIRKGDNEMNVYSCSFVVRVIEENEII